VSGSQGGSAFSPDLSPPFFVFGTVRSIAVFLLGQAGAFLKDREWSVYNQPPPKSLPLLATVSRSVISKGAFPPLRPSQGPPWASDY